MITVSCFAFLVGLCATARAQDFPSERKGGGSWGSRIHQELRVFIYEEFDEESEYEEYEQLFPVEVPFGTRGATGGVSGKFTLMSGCRWRKKEPTLPASLAFPLLPQEDEARRDLPHRDPPQDPPPPWKFPPTEIPPSWTPLIPTNYNNLPLTLTLQMNPLTTNIRVGSGSVFNLNALNSQGSQIVNLPPGGGIVPQPGDPLNPPPPPNPGTKLQDPAAKGILGGGDSDNSDDSDTPLLVGPEMALPVKADVTEWGVFEWLPASTSLSVYGHALFGEMKIFERPLDVSLYGVGPRFGLPIVRESWLLIDGLVSSGPAFLHTDIGDTAGVDVATGLGAQLNLAGTLSFMASAEFRGYFAPDVNAYGPSFNLGLNLGW